MSEKVAALRRARSNANAASESGGDVPRDIWRRVWTFRHRTHEMGAICMLMQAVAKNTCISRSTDQCLQSMMYYRCKVASEVFNSI